MCRMSACLRDTNTHRLHLYQVVPVNRGWCRQWHVLIIVGSWSPQVLLNCYHFGKHSCTSSMKILASTVNPSCFASTSRTDIDDPLLKMPDAGSSLVGTPFCPRCLLFSFVWCQAMNNGYLACMISLGMGQVLLWNGVVGCSNAKASQWPATIDGV